MSEPTSEEYARVEAAIEREFSTLLRNWLARGWTREQLIEILLEIDNEDRVHH